MMDAMYRKQKKNKKKNKKKCIEQEYRQSTQKACILL